VAIEAAVVTVVAVATGAATAVVVATVAGASNPGGDTGCGDYGWCYSSCCFWQRTST